MMYRLNGVCLTNSTQHPHSMYVLKKTSGKEKGRGMLGGGIPLTDVQYRTDEGFRVNTSPCMGV